MTVYVKCGKCGNQEKCMIQTDSKEAIDNSIFQGNIQQCTKCGSAIEVSNKTMYWKNDYELFGKQLQKNQKKRIASELAMKIEELIEKKELSFDEAEPIIKQIFMSYSQKEPELSALILKKLQDKYSENQINIETS